MSSTRRLDILLVRDRDFFVHVFHLAQVLLSQGHRVTVLNTYSAPIEPLYRDLIDRACALGIECVLVDDIPTTPKRVTIRLQALKAKLRIGLKERVITREKLRKAGQRLQTRTFDCIIAFDPASLYLACRLYPHDLGRIIDYSIEVVQEDHPLFGDPRMRSLVRFERRVLPRLKALLIQDAFRAKLLMANAGKAASRAQVIHFPVAVGGPAVRERTSGLYDELLGEGRRVRVLFFGGLWSSTLLEELREVAKGLQPDEVLLVHGGRGSAKAGALHDENFAMTRTPVTFDQLDSAIAGADIGLALYPDDEPNSRYTAFSSEKIARYLKCGLPFIAFRNEDYEFLESQEKCCVLIRSLQEIPAAVREIRKDYDRFRESAFLAFSRFYDLDVASRDLVRFLEAS